MKVLLACFGTWLITQDLLVTCWLVLALMIYLYRHRLAEQAFKVYAAGPKSELRRNLHANVSAFQAWTTTR